MHNIFRLKYKKLPSGEIKVTSKRYHVFGTVI
jgi:hypothetical protein